MWTKDTENMVHSIVSAAYFNNYICKDIMMYKNPGIARGQSIIVPSTNCRYYPRLAESQLGWGHATFRADEDNVVADNNLFYAFAGVRVSFDGEVENTEYGIKASDLKRNTEATIIGANIYGTVTFTDLYTFKTDAKMRSIFSDIYRAAYQLESKYDFRPFNVKVSFKTRFLRKMYENEYLRGPRFAFIYPINNVIYTCDPKSQLIIDRENNAASNYYKGIASSGSNSPGLTNR